MSPENEVGIKELRFNVLGRFKQLESHLSAAENEEDKTRVVEHRNRILGLVQKAITEYSQFQRGKNVAAETIRAELEQLIKEVGLDTKMVELKPSEKKEDPELKLDSSKIQSEAYERKKALAEIGKLSTFKDEKATSGFMGEFAAAANADLPQKIDQYKERFQEEFPEGQDLSQALAAMPPEVGRRFDAHGIAKGGEFASFINLLTKGVNPEKNFSTTNLMVNIEAGQVGAVNPYDDGGIIVIGPVNEPKEMNAERKGIFDTRTSKTDIQYVALDQQYYFALPQLQEAFPNIKFVKAKDLVTFMSEEVKKKDSAK